MREDVAALNVTRTYTLAASNIAIFTFMLFFLYPRFESGRINAVLFQATLIAMGIATFSLVFATLHYYRCSLAGGMSDTERALHARRADGFWLLGYTTMFLSPSLVLFLIRLRIVASVWFAFWLVYVFFVARYSQGCRRRERPKIHLAVEKTSVPSDPSKEEFRPVRARVVLLTKDCAAR